MIAAVFREIHPGVLFAKNDPKIVSLGPKNQLFSNIGMLYIVGRAFRIRLRKRKNDHHLDIFGPILAPFWPEKTKNETFFQI